MRVVVAIVCIWGLALASDEEARALFQEAKEKCVAQKWKNAINLFEDFLEKYPTSRYCDDAVFWKGYSLEKMPGSQIDAFITYSELVSKHTESPWIDDAQIHQISLAEQFVSSGMDQYVPFLHDKLNSSLQEVGDRAAIALGRLGDDTALTRLQKIRTDEDLGGLASNLIALLEARPLETALDTVRGDLGLVYKRDFSRPESSDKESFLWFNSQRYEQYRSMLRREESWTQEELNDFALWHITDSDEFEAFRSLENEYDRKEWQRKFWKKKDPTPTTAENELLREFRRRIRFVRTNFSKLWNYRHFRYLPDQHLREGWLHAPWDARGELYIKYGEPDARSTHAWHTEEWVYYRYGVDFIVKQYMTNIYGNAINAGQMTRFIHDDFGDNSQIARVYPFLNRGQQDYLDWNTYNHYLDANFIYNNEMRYEHNYQAEPIEDFDMSIEGRKIIYRLNAEDFSLTKRNGSYELSYIECFVIMDEDMRQIGLEETEKKVTSLPDDDTEFETIIELNLPPGVYRISLRVKDKGSDKLGIYTQDFAIR